MFLDVLSQSASDVGEDIVPANIISKVSLLVLHFPRLRIVWSRSLHATADIFAALKANQDEPDLDRAMRVGVPTEDGLIEGDIRFESCLTSVTSLGSGTWCIWKVNVPYILILFKHLYLSGVWFGVEETPKKHVPS
jgi:hypothetical protein